MFAEAGCDDQHLSEQPVKGSKLPNVICILPGSSDKIIIVGAHFDHVSEGDGVVDNWSGASVLPSLYESVRIVPRKHTYIFIGFTDEEQGELGSRFYVRHMSKDQVAGSDAMVNLDTLGLGPAEMWVTIRTNVEWRPCLRREPIARSSWWRQCGASWQHRCGAVCRAQDPSYYHPLFDSGDV
jgi:hypothetical protein